MMIQYQIRNIMAMVTKKFNTTRFQAIYDENEGPDWGKRMGDLEISETIEITIDIKKYGDGGYRWETTRTNTITGVAVFDGNLKLDDYEHMIGESYTDVSEHRTNSEGSGLWYITERGEHDQCRGTCQYRIRGNTEEKAANWLLWKHSRNL
jgi:hypothetical protein